MGLVLFTARMQIVAHNADETDPKTGEMRWKVERGKRKKKITFSLESVNTIMHGGRKRVPLPVGMGTDYSSPCNRDATAQNNDSEKYFCGFFRFCP